MTVAVSAVMALVILCAWGLYRRHLRIGYFICSVLLGLTLAGTTLGGHMLNGMNMIGSAINSVSNSVWS